MAFSFGSVRQFTRLLLSKIGDSGFRWTPRRIGVVLGFYLLYPMVELVIWSGLLLDDLLYRGYRQVEIDRPVFIVGNPRSGTTFLYQLMARDRETFATMQLWEILFAPSITLRKVAKGLAALDRRLHRPLQKRVAQSEKRWHELNARHRLSLRAPEEDEFILVHIFSTLAIWLNSGLFQATRPYIHFDAEMPPEEKKRVMSFYQRCLQRHLYARGGSHKHYLAKNPAFCPKLGSLYECFPDARIIYLVRNPLYVIPSFFSMMTFTQRVFGDPAADRECREHILKLTRHWYTYPLQRLERAPQDSYVVVRYDDLVADPEGTLADIYQHLGLPLNPTFASVLREEVARARQYRSKHRYSLEQMGLTREQILTDYRDVFDRFGFDTTQTPRETDPTVERVTSCRGSLAPP
jgi:hypothetical protein